MPATRLPATFRRVDIPNPVLQYFRLAPLEDVEHVLPVLRLIVVGRRADEQPGTGHVPPTPSGRKASLQDLTEAILRDVGRPLDVLQLLDEFAARYPGRVTEKGLRAALYKHAKALRGRITKGLDGALRPA